MVSFYDPVTQKEISYHIDKRMIKVLDHLKMIISKKDMDAVMVVDGGEGTGKSTFSQQAGKYVDPTLDLSRICMTADEFKQAIINAKHNECVIYDEAVTGMSAGDSITRIGKLLKSMMMQMRQKNLFVIVIIPSLFELNKYTILSRARCFFHIYESKGKRGYFVGYNKKDTRNLYFKGKKFYSYKVRSRFIGRFCGKYVVDEQTYRKKKEDALFKLDDILEKGNNKEKKYMAQRDNLIYLLNKLGYSQHKLEELLKQYSPRLGHTQIGEIVRRIKELNEEKLEIPVQGRP